MKITVSIQIKSGHEYYAEFLSQEAFVHFISLLNTDNFYLVQNYIDLDIYMPILVRLSEITNIVPRNSRNEESTTHFIQTLKSFDFAPTVIKFDPGNEHA